MAPTPKLTFFEGHECGALFLFTKIAGPNYNVTIERDCASFSITSTLCAPSS